MRDPHVHDEQRSFMLGLITGAMLGAGLAILFAPRRGSELRSQLSEPPQPWPTAPHERIDRQGHSHRVGGTRPRSRRSGRAKGAAGCQEGRGAGGAIRAENVTERGPYAAGDEVAESAMFDATTRRTARALIPPPHRCRQTCRQRWRDHRYSNSFRRAHARCDFNRSALYLIACSQADCPPGPAQSQ